jgi:hypothetical protein
MKSDFELQRIVRSWLEDGVNVLPDRVLDDVLAQLPMTPRRRVTWWPARRVIDMNRNLRLGGLAAAALVVVVLGAIGLGLLRPSGAAGPGSTLTPAPSASPTPSPTAVPTPVPTPTPRAVSSTMQGATLAAGTYLIEAPFEIPYTITFGEQWNVREVSPQVSTVWMPGAVGGSADISVVIPANVFPDPCNPEGGPLDPAVEQTVDGYVNALTSMEGWTAGPVTDIDLGGRPGKTFVLTPPFVDPADCAGALPPLMSVADPPLTVATNADLYLQMTVVDVDGTPVVIATDWHESTSAATRAAMDEAAASISFE